MSVWNMRNNTGLGDYIHYRRENYENHGIFRKYGKSSDFDTAINYAYQNLRQMARNRDGIGGQAIELQNYLNGMRNGLSGRDLSYLKEEDAAEIEAKRQFLYNSIQEALSDSTTLSAKIGNFDVSENNSTAAIIARYSGLKDTSRKSIRRDTVIKLAQQAKAILKQTDARIKKGTLSGQDITALLKEKNELLAIKKSLEVELAKSAETGKALIAYRNTIKTNTTEADLNEFGEVLKNLYRVSRKLRLPLNEDLGNVAEAGVATLLSMAGRTAKETSAKLVKEAVKAGSKTSGSNAVMNFSTTFVNSDTLLKEINKDKNNKTKVSWSLSENGSLATIQTSQDTVDIHIDFPPNSDTFGLNDLNASIKNVGSIFSGYGINVISATPLNSILNLTNVSFANHYLNLLSQMNYDQEVQQGNEVITYALAVRALTGARSSTFSKKSDFFIVNSRSNNKLYVFSSEDLLKKICPGNSVNFDFLKVSGLPKSSKILTNKWMGEKGVPDLGGAQQRIASIVAQTNRFKLSMSIMPSKMFNLT